jgi:hypothetical protein
MPAQPRLRGKLIVAGLFFYLLFLILQMPLAWLIARLPADSPIQLHQAKGSAWNGSVRQVIWQAEADRIDLGQLNWKWQPGELLDGRIGFDFELGRTARNIHGSIMLGHNSLVLNNVRGKVDATLLGFVSRPLSLLQPQGNLLLDVANLSLTHKRIHGSARLEWQNAQSGIVAAPLGDYRAELNTDPDGRRALINVHTVQGPLRMNGNAEYLPGKEFRGTLRLTPPQAEGGQAYRPLLSLLGKPDANGTWLLLLNQR